MLSRNLRHLALGIGLSVFIKEVWQVDPLICPHCGAEMKLIALIDDDEVIERILRHLNL